MRLKLLLAGAVLPVVLWSALPVLSEGSTRSGRLSRIQSQIAKKEAKIHRHRGAERVLTSDISAYTRRIRRLQGRIDVLSIRVGKLQQNLDRKRAALVLTQQRLRLERARLVRLRGRLFTARQQLARRLVELYQQDEPDLLTVVLNAKGFADVLEQTDFLKRIAAADRSIVAAVRNAKADALATARELDALERRQRALTATVMQRRDAIASVRRDLIVTRVGYARTSAGKQRALAGIRVSRRHLQAEVRGLRSQQARIASALQRAARGNVGQLPAGPVRGNGGGPLIWPVNGPITSPFCERRAWESCHPGLDIGVPEGTPIRAAAAGKVVLLQSVASSGGYGNYTCIQHTNSMSTCYAHQSRFATSLGASVRQGQVFGYVGNTGHSFGAHLHFEVRVNGAVVNPLNYL